MIKAFLQKVAAVLVISFMAAGGLAVAMPASYAAAMTQDCDDNAIMRCGVRSRQELKTKYDQNQGGNGKAIFAHYSIDSKADLDGMVPGRVTKSGDVYVGAKRVAERANSAGRHNLPGSTKIPGVNAYMRPTTVSFRSDSLDAYVQMKGGTFRFAVIKACGNPVQAHPVKPKQSKPTPGKPNLTIKKDVRVLGNREFQQMVEADLGDQLQYRLTIKNVAKVDAKNLHIQDSLPQGVTYQDGNLTGSQAVTGFKISDLVGSGIDIATLAKGDLIEINFVVTIGGNVDACEESLRNVASVKATDVSVKKSEAHAKVCRPEQPVTPTTPETPEQPHEHETHHHVQGVQTLTRAGSAGVIGAFSATSILGFAAYKLKDFFLVLLNR